MDIVTPIIIGVSLLGLGIFFEIKDYRKKRRVRKNKILKK